MEHEHSYIPPSSLIVISTISIGLGAIASGVILIDIIVRRGWKSMMLVMIPVYVLNALYIFPVTLWVYLKYGRPNKPELKPTKEKDELDHSNNTLEHSTESHDHTNHIDGQHMQYGHQGHDDCIGQEMIRESKEGDIHHHHRHHSNGRPMFVTVTVGVCHCGAACLLGDIIGEWIVYGTGATISGKMLYPEFLIDFAFAIVIGIFFQYFSIAPMAGDYGPKTLVRAAKTDFLSLLFFQVGLFGWMAIFELAIFQSRLEMNNVTYWWMMQVGMFLGHWTSIPINWWLITKHIKEPCA